MIKALIKSDTGQKVFLGITQQNVKKLQEGKPIHIPKSEGFLD